MSAKRISTPVHIKDLVADPANRRVHNDRNLGMVVDSLQDVGAARSIVIDEKNEVLAGNGVIAAATLAGITKVRVIDADGDTIVAVRRLGLSDQQKRSLAIYDNRSGELATWNFEQLQSDLTGGLSLRPFWTAEEEVAILAKQQAKVGLIDPDDAPKERATDIRRGHLFELGRHRLLCGDSTAEGDVDAVLDGNAPGLLITDPPYGVQYDPAWRARAGVNRNTKKLGAVANDDNADWREAWTLFKGNVAYIWHAGLKAGIVEASLSASGFELRSQIVWAKDRLALSRGDYHWQHEPCWYAVRRGEKADRNGDRTQTTLWTIPARDDAGHGHGTQKPVECMARPMRNHDVLDVYEPFSGSGTTLIAAQQLTRRCFAIEIEPRYVQMAIDRWEQFTGMRARKVGEV